MIKINLDIEKLKAAIIKHTVEVPILMGPYYEKAINATELFEEIHECVDCDKDTFVRYVNSMPKKDAWAVRNPEFERIVEIDTLFSNVNFPGMFMIHGYEQLKNQPWIMHKDIVKTIKLQ